MQTLLLVVPNTELRQLYHEILFSSELEVVPLADLSVALMLVTVVEFQIIVIYMQDETETEVFLKLRKSYQRLLHSRLVLLTDEDKFKIYVYEKDKLLSPLKLTIEQIGQKIKSMV